MEKTTMCYGWTAAQSLFFHSTITQAQTLTDNCLPACRRCDTPETETLYNRFVRYLEDAHRDGVIAAGLHRTGSDAVFRYTFLELADRNVLMKAAFDG